MSLFTLGEAPPKRLPRTRPDNIDPATGKPFVFYGTPGDGRSGLQDWVKQGTQMGDPGIAGNGGDAMGAFSYTPEFLQSIGYQGQNPMGFQGSPDSGAMGMDPAFTQFLQDKGLTLGTSLDGPETDQWKRGRAFDAQGNPVGQESRWRPDVNSDAFFAAMLAGGAFGGAAAAGVGASAAGAGEAAAPTSFSTAGANGMLLTPEQIAAGETLGSTGVPAQAGASNLATAFGGGALDPAAAGLSVAPEIGTVGGGGGLSGGLGLGGGIGGFGGSGLTSAELLAGGTGAAGLTGAASSYGGGLANYGNIGQAFTPGSYQDPYSSMPGTPSSSTPNLSQASQLGKLLSGGVGTALAGAGAAALGSGGGSVGVPNYQGAAQSQGLSARTDQTNPYGSLKYTQTGVDAQGNPTYKQDVSLNPQGASNLSSAQTAQGTALGSWNDVLKNAGVDWSSIPGIYGAAGSQENLVNQARDAMYSSQTRYLDPQYKQQQDSLASSLANQGVTMGSQAYTTAMDNFARQRDSAYGAARDSSINQGNAFAGQLFGQGLQAHNAGVSDWSTRLGQTGNAATTAAGNANSFNPSFAPTPQPTNFLGAAALQGQGNLNQYNATTGAQNSFNNGLFNLGGSVLSNPSWTDLIGNFFKPGP